MKSFQKLAGAYKTAALITFNTLLLFVAANLLLFVGNLVWRAVTPGPGPRIVAKYGLELLKQVYPGMSRDDVMQLLTETWTRPFAFEPYTQFKDAPFAGRFVNVDPNGFRHGQTAPPWPPAPQNFNVFVFGGSTVFGYGVADNQTVVARLQEQFPATIGGRKVCCYNFGRGFYYSSQERVLFEQLLAAGIKPDQAIFIDGLNEFFFTSDQPKFSSDLAEFVNGDYVRQHPLGIFAELPVLRKLAKVGRFFSRNARSDSGPADAMAADSGSLSEAAARAICQRYLRNQQLIEGAARQFGVPVCFVWQPVPTYKYDATRHPFMNRGFRQHSGSGQGYVAMAALLGASPPAKNFLWCADMQQSLQEPLYVDIVHYSGRMNELFAAEIVRQMQERGLLPMAN